MRMYVCKFFARRFAALVLFSSLLAVGHVCAQASAHVLPQTFAGHSATRAGAQTQSTDGFTVPSSGVLKEYELQSIETQDYGDGNNAIVYKMKDPSGAYGLYSYLRAPDMAKIDTTAHSSMSNARALLLVGNFVIDVRGTELAKHASALNAIAQTAKARAHDGPLPDLTEHLPVNGFVDRSDKYVLGPVVLHEFFPLADDDWLGFYAGAEAEVAKYRVNGGRELTLVLADFPTPKSAQKRLNDLQRDLHVNPKVDEAGGSPVYARRAITMIAIVSGAKNEAEANLLLDQIQSGAEVTWSEPTFRFKEPTIGGMIVGSIEATAVICLFALVAGIGFGGFRLITKRLLPGRVFDRTATMEVLQLGLGSKPINAEDFYGIEGKQSE